MTEKTHPKVTLVGAGPGDPELVTLKGILALNKADVVLYDALIDAALLNHAPAKALKIFVGKRHGQRTHPQEEINQLCVAYAKKHGHVVRLKGGDPFVFGRGAEEIDFIEGYGIPTEVIPGITSAVAVPACIGVPVTKRGVSESFWVITATTSSGNLSSDLYLASQSTATVVVLMGTRKLPEIVQIYRQLGHGEMPLAIIQSGTTKEECSVIGCMEDIEEKAAKIGIGPPAVIVIGEVVREARKLKDIHQELEINGKFA
ncbi:uroporphyrinogen-III C-methyltransferase [Pleomorphovibrio marinus]|uniref:uroporphyrinogen-III C-methyltransferase n=1 Tax=Pleomorphovibrio marinus TaxID=2164132 RepID=UPI000E0C12ED|nr:uroporphyrinogen-III C-methyltransferase [Pleomorphovibrio marinus]